MRKQLILLSAFLIITSISACEFQDLPSETETASSQTVFPEPPSAEEPAERVQQQAATDKNKNISVTEDRIEEKNELVLSVNGNTLNVSWESSDTVDELIAYVQNENIVVDTTLYSGFEQVGYLPQNFSRNDVQMSTEPGDIVLYSGNQLVVFFGSNSWSYTMLGHIEGVSAGELSELLGKNSAVIEIKLS